MKASYLDFYVHVHIKFIFHYSVASMFLSITQKSILRNVENTHILDSIVFRKAAAHYHKTCCRACWWAYWKKQKLNTFSFHH